MTSHAAQMDALAFLYDHAADFPTWIQRLTPRQLEQIARVMASWRQAIEPVIPLEEVEKREIIRAISVCDGDAMRAAKLLCMGKTTMYRKIREWHLIDETLYLNKHRSRRKGQAIASGLHSDEASSF